MRVTAGSMSCRVTLISMMLRQRLHVMVAAMFHGSRSSTLVILQSGIAGQSVGQPALRINVVQFGGFNQGIGDGCGFAACR